MKIDANQGTGQTVLQSLTASGALDADFQATLALAQKNAARDSSAATLAEKKIAAPDALKKAQDELSEYLKKPIAQHMRDAILKEMGLTEADVAAMPPEKRAAVEATITEKIKERMQEAQAKNNANTVQNYGLSQLSLLTIAGQKQTVRNPYD